jgi:dTDP-4-amino-4,6-dideoxygalactose transaminase
MPIPFNSPTLIGTEEQYLRKAIQRMHFSGNGYFTKSCQDLLAQYLGANKVLLTTSCTTGLEMSALLLNIVPGDEVIVPSFTFVSTANAFVLRGARPVFVDIRRDTMNMDENLLEDAISSRTKAIVPVHYAGVGCEMDRIAAVATKHRLAIVEDNAQGLFGRYRNRPLGSFGCLATQSFHETKNISCGEGGALVINDPAYVERAEILWEKGTNRSKYFRGLVDKYTWVDLGSSFLPSEILAAFLFAQLEVCEQIQNRRQAIWHRYDSGLTSWAADHNVQTPFVPEHCQQSYHMYYLLFPDLEERTRFISHLRSREIWAVFHYQPLHCSTMGERFGGREGDCPVAEDVADRLVRLPFFNSLSEIDQDIVIAAICDYA